MDKFNCLEVTGESENGQTGKCHGLYQVHLMLVIESKISWKVPRTGEVLMLLFFKQISQMQAPSKAMFAAYSLLPCCWLWRGKIVPAL